MTNIKASLLTSLFLLFLTLPAFALSTISLTWQQRVDLADRVFKGTVVDIDYEDDVYESNMLVVYYTFRVEDCLKGDCQDEVVFKQLAAAPVALPEYQKGQSYLLLLSADSELTGLTAPVGLQQGSFVVEKQNGKWVVPAFKNKPHLVSKAKKQITNRAALKQLSHMNSFYEYDSVKLMLQSLMEES